MLTPLPTDLTANEQAAVDALGALLNRLPNDAARSEALTMFMLLAYNLLRQFEDDHFVRGWLESALKELAVAPPIKYQHPQ